MASDKELQAILSALENQGFTIRRTKKGHFQISLGPNIVAVFAGTASDPRSLRNSLADCKRAGFIWPPPSAKRKRGGNGAVQP